MSIETEQDLEALRRVGRVVAETIAAARERVRPGMTTAELDAIGEEVFARHGAPNRLRARGAHDRGDARSAAGAHRSLSRRGPDFITSAKPHQTMTQAGQK